MGHNLFQFGISPLHVYHQIHIKDKSLQLMKNMALVLSFVHCLK